MKKFASTAALLVLLLGGYVVGDRLGWWNINSVVVNGDLSGSGAISSPVAGSDPDALTSPSEEDSSYENRRTTTPDEADSSPNSSGEQPSAERKIAVVSGHIYRTDGASLEGATVFLWGGEQPGSLVDADGVFRIESPEEKGGSVYLEHNGAKTALDSTVRPVFDDEIVLEIEVAVGHSVILETIDRKTQRPIRDAEIVIKKSAQVGQAGVIFATTDASGRVTCDYLIDGDYTVEATHSDYTRSDSEFSAPREGAIVCQLDPARPLEVTLVGYSEYPPQERATLDLWQESGGSMNVSQAIGEDGTFTINAPPTGRWRGVLSTSPEFPYVSFEFNVPEGDGAVLLPIQVPARGQTTVAGRLVDGIGDPIPNAGRLAIGKFYIPVQSDGSYQLEHVTGGRHEARLLVGGGDDFSERHLDWVVIPDSGDVHRDFVIEGRGRVLLKLSGLPADQQTGAFGSGIRRLDDPSGRSLASKIGPAHKDIEFDRLAVGRYQVSPGLVFSDVRGRSSYAWGGRLPFREIEIRSDTDVIELIVEIPEPSRLEFLVGAPPGSTVPGVVSIHLQGDSHERMRFPFVELVDRTAKLNFYVSGQFEVTIDLDVFETITENVTLRAGEPTRRTLKPTARP